MKNSDLISFIQAANLDITGRGKFILNDIRDYMMVDDNEYFLVYGVAGNDKPTFLVVQVISNVIQKTVVVDDDKVEDVLHGFICLDEVLEPAQCVFNQQNVSYGQSRSGMSIHVHNESLKGFSR
ncbi:TPA: hypothetical protein PMB18_001512 [Vibrio cholerae]|nr:hypothetical protein [Vibrio cholerae]